MLLALLATTARVRPVRRAVSVTAGAGAPVAEGVFRVLARDVLVGRLAPGTELPPERELARRFGVSRIIVRQAIHRLKEHDLVTVRQGAATLVKDPSRATDIRLVDLELELNPSRDRDARDVSERQMLGSLALVVLAERRITDAELDALDRIVEEWIADGASENQLAFERRYWTALARATRNRVYVRETLWMFNVVERDPRRARLSVGRRAHRVALYQSLNQKLRERSGAAEAYLRITQLGLALLEAQTEPNPSKSAP